MVNHVDGAEVRIAIALVLAAAADAVLVAQRLPKIGAHLVTARPVEEIVLRQEARASYAVLAYAPHVFSRVTFMRDARAPPAGHTTHFNPQHWLLCHMGLY